MEDDDEISQGMSSIWARREQQQQQQHNFASGERAASVPWSPLLDIVDAARGARGEAPSPSLEKELESANVEGDTSVSPFNRESKFRLKYFREERARFSLSSSCSHGGTPFLDTPSITETPEKDEEEDDDGESGEEDGEDHACHCCHHPPPQYPPSSFIPVNNNNNFASSSSPSRILFPSSSPLHHEQNLRRHLWTNTILPFLVFYILPLFAVIELGQRAVIIVHNHHHNQLHQNNNNSPSSSSHDDDHDHSSLSDSLSSSPLYNLAIDLSSKFFSLWFPLLLCVVLICLCSLSTPGRRRQIDSILSWLLVGVMTLVAPFSLARAWKCVFFLSDFSTVGAFVQYLGVVILVAGGILVVYSHQSIAAAGASGPMTMGPPILVVHGTYAHLRNPIVLGTVLAVLGHAFMWRSIVVVGGFSLWTLFVLSVHVCIIEEPLLLAKFGREYEEYRENVPRFGVRFSPWKREGRDDKQKLI